MTPIESSYKVAKYKNGRPYYGEVFLHLELTQNSNLEIIENYEGIGWTGQGYQEIISEKGYDTWKKGIQIGISYAYNKLKHCDGLKVTVVQACGLTTDTNPTILAFAASRTILNTLENMESEGEFSALEALMFSSWKYDLDAIPNLDEALIMGTKL